MHSSNEAYIKDKMAIESARVLLKDKGVMSTLALSLESSRKVWLKWQTRESYMQGRKDLFAEAKGQILSA